MNLDEYQKEAGKTMDWSKIDINEYLCVKLEEEISELKGRLIEGCGRPLDTKSLVEELGDIMWYVAILASHNNIFLQAIAEYNISKLRERHGESYNEDYYQNKELP